MIRDNYLESAIETIQEIDREMQYEIDRLIRHDVDPGNLEHIHQSVKKVMSLLVRIREAFS
ncbi:hypothetical protein GF339_03470 [candidate division KSB3 bacterium]|uniref:Uncharacterized protein n=1 Tax=candidate division KSB3 bacterium TaxID=2044937 RepID=A0A9D5JTD1_9BACT|nr:hypothetical protein [candidate division KSB3 bacterium]MBD3323617.1 hypothetical protein [candidate division KSB3 bacterium]